MRLSSVLLPAAALLLLAAACARGPEGAALRLPEPAATPATDLASRQTVPVRPGRGCLVNRTGQTVEFTLAQPAGGRQRSYRLHAGETLRFDRPERALISFLSADADAADAAIASRFYALDPAQQGRACGHSFRLDRQGRLDIFRREI